MIQYSLVIIFIIILFFNSSRIAIFFKLIDFPNENRKIHLDPIPKVGGIIIYIGILLYFLVNNNFIQNTHYIIFVSFFFLVGLLDDLSNLSSSFRLITCFIFTFIFLIFNPEIRINEILIFEKNINLNSYLNYFSIILITTLSILLLQNAINMIDGMNGICAFFIIISILYLNFNYLYLEISFFILFLILTFTYFNLMNKTFLGNSGSYLLSSILSYKILFINSNELGLTSEKIFLLLLIPGIDMLRLFIIRIFNKKNPFKADSNHLHHLLLYYLKNKKIKTLLIYLTLSFTPLIISSLHIINDIFIISLSIFLYVIMIIKLKFLKTY